jgi:hypothetical protein
VCIKPFRIPEKENANKQPKSLIGGISRPLDLGHRHLGVEILKGKGKHCS